MIEDFCKDMKLKHSVIYPFEMNTYVIFTDNKLSHHEKFQAQGYTKKEASLAEKSLKTVLPSGDSDPIELTEEEIEYVEEVNSMDESYQVFDEKGNPLNIDEFKCLELEDQLFCTVVRPDGTVMYPGDNQSVTPADIWDLDEVLEDRNKAKGA